PDLDATRFNLANLYQSMDQTELALPLYQEALKRQRRTGVSAGDSMEQYSARLRSLEENVKSLEAIVKRQRDLHEANSSQLTIADRAEQATQKGLAQTALNTLLDADSASFGPPGLKLEMELLLLTGRVQEVRDWLTEDYLNPMGEMDFRW